MNEKLEEFNRYVELPNEQLRRAKEIIKGLIRNTYGQNLKTQNDFTLYAGLIKDAEQFINDNKIVCDKETGKFFGTVS